jgi:predicted ribosome quality control (RQC) complex YloA/Tae2 family protein
MEDFFLGAVVDSVRPLLVGQSLGRVWQPDERSLAIDLKLDDGRALFVSVDPGDPGLYLTSRSPRELERDAAGDRPFAALVRKRLRGARVEEVAKSRGDRVVTLTFSAFEPSGGRSRLDLVVALTGRSANAYLVDDAGEIAGTLRPVPATAALRPGERFALPPRPTRPGPGGVDGGPTIEAELEFRAARDGMESALASLAADGASWDGLARLYTSGDLEHRKLVLATYPLRAHSVDHVDVFDDPSAAADARSRRLESARALAAARRSVRDRAETARAKAARLAAALDADEAATSGAERDREVAESLLAQVATARTVDGGLAIVDYYDSEQREIVVPADRGETPQQIAERLFASQRKAKRARAEIELRRAAAVARRDALEALLERLGAADSADAIARLDGELDALLGVRRVEPAEPGRAGKRATARISGVRRFASSDGFEILVGRSSAANDALTFKVARSSDLWLHAADYPGSHVVVRNPARADLPYRTIVEAAQLAAFFSEARGDATVEVRYTPRKFVSKPRGAAPGLVRISTFKTVAVSPSADLPRLDGT